MTTNNFKPFGIGSGANVTSQEDYEALAALTSGFVSGKASSAQINKAFRQATVMAYVLAQFISDSASVDVLDNGNPAQILSNLKSGLLSSSPGRLLSPPKPFAVSGTYTPTAGTKFLRVKVWGAGGGGGGALSSAAQGSTSGGGGAYAETWMALPVVATIPITIGSGGTAGGANSTTPGGAGGSSSFGTYLICPGGLGGSATVPGAGGAAPTSTILSSSGQAGQGSITGSLLGGQGGASFSSFGGLAHYATAGDAGGLPGGGGAGGTSGQGTYGGGKGANGYIIIEEYA